MTSVHTTLSELMRQPVGSTCLYQTPLPNAYHASINSIAIHAGGAVCIEPLFAIDLVTKDVIDICRVTVERSANKQTVFKASTVHFCAPYAVLVRCKKGTSCLYEDFGKTNKIYAAAEDINAKIKITLYHTIDIQRGTTQRMHRVEVIKQGDPYIIETVRSAPFKNFL